MTSKEKLALIKETWYDVDLTDEKYIDFDEEQTFSDLEKDLEELEELKKIMGTPIQDIMKRLKILEILKEHLALKLDERQCDKYLIKMVSEDTGNYTYIRLYEEEVKKLLEGWLNGKD